jgi:hypothetical protein
VIALGLAAAAAAGEPARLDRVDLLSESGATFLVYDLPRYGTSPDVVTLRWFEQVAAVGAVGRTTLSLSLTAQTLAWEPRIPGFHPLSTTVGLRTHAFLPDGGVVGLAVRGGPVRVGASVLLLSDATWSRPDWGHWSALPAVGLGLGPTPQPRAAWME